MNVGTFATGRYNVCITHGACYKCAASHVGLGESVQDHTWGLLFQQYTLAAIPLIYWPVLVSCLPSWLGFFPLPSSMLSDHVPLFSITQNA
jgi:hypothetical protein